MLNKLNLKATEYYIIFTSIIFFILALFVGVEFRHQMIYLFSIAFVFSLSFVFKPNKKENLLRYILNVPPAFLLYSGVLPIIKKMHSGDMDYLLIAIDQWVFGANPTELLAGYSHPIITEYLQISYFSFFLLPLIIAVELLIKKKQNQFIFFTRNIVFAFLLSYILYFFIPAIGPRFTIHNFESLNQELPGLFFTEYIRDFINYGGGITNIYTDASTQVNRDCMPSGHTMMTTIYILLAFRFNIKFKYFILAIGLSLILSTIYLRYHYVIDVIAGFIFAFVSILLESTINRKFINN